MTDKQKENAIETEVLPQNGNAVAVAAQNSCIAKPAQIEPAQDADSAKTPPPAMSKGEKIFDWTVYTGLNYWVNLISSVAIADYFVNRGGRDKLNNLISKTTKLLTETGIPLKAAHHNSKIGLETLALLSGGTALLAPLKIMEDNKRPIVHWLNKKLGVNQKAPDGHEKTPDEIHIECEVPKQSWGRVIWRRVMGTAAVVGTGIALDHLLRDKKTILPPEPHDLGWTKVTYDEKVLGGKERITKTAFGLIDHGSEMVRGKKFAENGIVSRWTKLTILDSVFTAITAFVMKITNGAKKAKMPKEIDDSKDPPVIKDEINRIITTADVENNNLFSDKVERRAKGLVEARRGGGPNHSFVENIQQQDASVIAAGV